MFRRLTRHRIAFWAVAFAMLLKAAMPMLASASADARGLTLVEVCTVYGVATVALDAQGAPAESPAHGASHTGDPCTLSALAPFAAGGGEGPAFAGSVSPPSHAPPAAIHLVTHHADSAWVARLKHGPPVLS